MAAPKPEPDQPGNLFEISLSGTGNSGSVVHPPLSLTAAKELWIFWYGEEPDLTDLLAPELLKSSGKLIVCFLILQNKKNIRLHDSANQVFFVSFSNVHTVINSIQ